MFRNPRRYYNNLRGGDPMTQLIAIGALIILLIVALPKLWAFIPGAASGVECVGMASPKSSASNQSILASQIDPAVLKLELVPPLITKTAGDALNMELRFINDSMAPLTLYISPDDAVFRYTQQEIGIMFSIQSIDGAVLGEPASARPVKAAVQQYNINLLHVLGPRQRCFARIAIDVGRLNAAKLTQGEYRVTAIYRNQFKGILPTNVPLSPTAIFRDQGVWVGQVQSNEIRVSVGVAAPQ